MTNALQVFKNTEFGEIRTIQQGEDILFVAADVCRALNLSNPSRAVARLDADERSNFKLGRQGEANVVNEYGLYSLVLTSRKPEAKAFKRWITHEVIPAIRKTGKYAVSSTPAAAEKEGIKYYNGVAVVTKKELAAALGTVASALQYYIKKENLLTEGTDYYVIGGQDLRAFKSKYKLVKLCTNLTLITESGARKLYEYMQKEYCPVLFTGKEREVERPQYLDIPGCEEAQKLIKEVRSLSLALDKTMEIFNNYNRKELAYAMAKTISRQAMELYVMAAEIKKCDYKMITELP